MLNKKKERELCYLVSVDKILPIEGADRVEVAVVGGWRIMVRKDCFKPGDPAIYFEIDSKVPATAPFEFLAAKDYKIKTQKYFKGTVISQGLLMAPSDFGWGVVVAEDDRGPGVVDDKGEYHFLNDESRFLTQKLGVVYSVAEDNVRKARDVDKYKSMAARHAKLFAHKPFRWLMRREWGKKLLFVFFGKKKNTNAWPAWVVKTDEERVQNIPWILDDKTEKWIATEKIDGTSTTFTMRRKRFNKKEFYVCSRNVVFDKPDKQCFYDTNVYLEMAQKYNIEKILTHLLDKVYPDAEWITLQGETYGKNIQKRDYHRPDRCFMGFNLIISNQGRMNSVSAAQLMMEYGIPWVPIISFDFAMPDTVDELLTIATGESTLDNGMREGLVFRSFDGCKSFKAVSNEFLMKYHV